MVEIISEIKPVSEKKHRNRRIFEKVHTLYCNSVCTFGTELSVVNAHHSMIPMV